MTTNSDRSCASTPRRAGGLLMVIALLLAAVIAVSTSTPAMAQQAPTSVTVATGPELMDAVNRAVDGQTVVLGAGQYSLTGTLAITKSITLRGAGLTDPDGSVISMASSVRAGVISVAAGAVVVIDGVTIAGGRTRGNGGGVLVSPNASLQLRNSTVRNNEAVEGAGIQNDGTLVVDSSTIADNIASKKGGGLRTTGGATVVNSTFTGNSGSQGGAMSVAGSAQVVHSTIVRNIATSSSSAGVDRNGGTVLVFYSIIGDNRRSNGSAASDCSGTPNLVGLNLVTNPSGCNPVGPIITATVAELGVAALADNGGATLTAALAETSPALDAIALTGGLCSSTGVLTGSGLAAVTDDQRGIGRPSGPGCDLGSFERADFGVELSLDVDTTNYQNLPAKYGPGVVEVGVSSVGIEDLAEALNAPAPTESNGTLENNSVRSLSVRSLSVRSLSVRSLSVRSLSVRSLGVRNVSVRNIGLSDIGARNTVLRDVYGIDTFITSIPLSEIPLLGTTTPEGIVLVPEGWSAYLAGTQYDGLPLQSLTVEALNAEPPVRADGEGLTPAFNSITLEDVDLSNSVLGELAVRSAALSGLPLIEIPPPADTTWCALFADLCNVIGNDDLLRLDLLSVQLAGEDVDAADVATVDLGQFLQSSSVRSLSVRSLSVRSLDLQNSGVSNISVRSLSVRSLSVRSLEKLLNCSDPLPLYCQDVDENQFTLGTLPEGAFNPTATVGDLLDAIGESTDPSLSALLAELSLADFLALFVARDQVPWEQIDLEAADLQNLGGDPQETFDYVARVKVTGSSADSLAVTVHLPKGFLLAGRPDDETSSLAGGALAARTPLTPVRAANGGLEYSFPPDARAPGDYVLRVPVRAGLVTGEFEALATLAATGPTGPVSPPLEARAIVQVVPVADDDGGGTAVGGAAASLSFGDLRLAHIASAGDVDLYSFTPNVDGGGARVLLSNIPEGVDYDLSIYGPTSLPLRGTAEAPVGTRTSLADIKYDLDPTDDVFPTDLADDIDLEVLDSLGVVADGYQLRDISSRRSNSDEVVSLPAVEMGKTYYVAVTSYLGDFSPKPYGIRVRLEGAVAPLECRASDRVIGTSSLSPFLAPGTTTNTLYLTNLDWLATDFPGLDDDITAAALATDDFDGSPVIDPAIIDVARDPAVETAYQEWANQPCDTDARNAVVRAIGQVLDTILTNSPVENIVILGGDGIVPMAAIPDLTGYSNEATAAQNVLTDGLNNPVAAALGAGYLLSDDPYGASAGIAIRNAGHQLYVPEVSIGRLVETGGEILQQLENFTAFKGRLDPGTAGTAEPSLSAAVTAYDFLADGGQAVAANLGVGVADVVTSVGDVDLLGATWTREDYLALFESGRFDIASPNAHYDWEALLPAAPDAKNFYTDAELVFSSDIAALTNRIERSLLFTIGCHAGLSVSDVQLGFPALDWAQTYARGDNQWIAHTTYGYGDDEIVAYSERLAAVFAAQVSAHLTPGPDAPTTLGEAMVRAKQEFLATTFTLTPYDEKILQSWTYYGMPMYRIGAGTGGSSEARVSTSSDSTQEAAASGISSDTETVAGSTVTPVSVALSRTIGQSGPANLNRVLTTGGTYYEVGGNTVTAQHRPVQPLVSLPVPSDIPAAGFLITGLTSIDERPLNPLYLQPMIDLAGNERRVEPADGSFPANLQLVTKDSTGRQRLLLAAGQFQAGVGEEPDTQRLFTNIEGQLYHNSQSDGIGPRVERVDTAEPVAGSPTTLEVTTDDRARRVVVLYQTGFDGRWASFDLAKRIDTNQWTGELPANNATRVVEFLVQAVDAQGDVGISDNKVQNFFDSPVPEGGELTITTSPAPNEVGYNNTDVTVTVAGGSSSDFDFVSLDGEEVVLDGLEVAGDGTAKLEVLVQGDGVHVVFARDSSGVGQFFVVTIDSTPPTINSDLSGVTPWTQQPVTVNFGAIDGLSGVASITTATTGASPATVTTAGATASVTVNVPGVTKVTAVATDVAGNESAPISVDVRIDRAAPVVEIIADPATGWARSFSVTVRAPFTAVEAPTTIEFQVGPTVDGAVDENWLPYVGAVPVATEGASLWARATDDAGNMSAVEFIVPQVDVTMPTASIRNMPTAPIQLGDVAIVVPECADVPSGIVSCVLSGNVSSTGQLDTTTVGPKSVTLTAIDQALNKTVVTQPYTVAYRVCELYDSSPPANAGSNYTIKLQLCDSQNRPTSDNGKLVLTAIEVLGPTESQFPIAPNFSGNSNSGFEFRWSAKDKQYVYNLSTDPSWGSGEFELGFVVTPSSLTIADRATLIANDGWTNVARFSLR